MSHIELKQIKDEMYSWFDSVDASVLEGHTASGYLGISDEDIRSIQLVAESLVKFGYIDENENPTEKGAKLEAFMDSIKYFYAGTGKFQSLFEEYKRNNVIIRDDELKNLIKNRIFIGLYSEKLKKNLEGIKTI